MTQLNTTIMQPLTIHSKCTSYEEPRLLHIKYLKKQNILALKGWSITPELSICYSVILKEIRAHLLESNTLTVYLAYELFNTVTAKFLFDMIKILNKAFCAGSKVKIHWITNVENESMFETGLELREFCEFDFHIQPA